MKQTIIFLISGFGLLLAIDVVSGTETSNTHKIGKSVIEKVPVERRGEFIRHHLRLALLNSTTQLNTPNKLVRSLSIEKTPKPFAVTNSFSETEVPQDFSANLLQWTEKEMKLSKTNVAVLVRTGIVCFPSGCLNPNDLGSFCCPF